MAELPDLPRGAGYTEAMRVLVEAVNGFVYPGDRLNAVVETVEVLRADPDLARQLLSDEARLGAQWRLESLTETGYVADPGELARSHVETPITDLQATIKRLIRERDEARAGVDRLAMERDALLPVAEEHAILRGALARLVELKDGPRDGAYTLAKDAAWRTARDVLAAVGEWTTMEAGDGH
jgi:hypothetical protein